MCEDQFDILSSLVTGRLTKKKTRLRRPISPQERLAICLRFLATGCSYAELAFGFRVGKSTVCKVINETCSVIIEKLQPLFLKAPTKRDHWNKIEEGFHTRWNFPNCVGALDGKHIAIQAPPSAGSTFFNYKKFHSIVLMAACDAEYGFTFVDVGNYGKHSDGGVFQNSYLGRKLYNDQAFLPYSVPLPNSPSTLTPFVFVADEAFPLQPHIMRPFPGNFLVPKRRIYNYRLSRARRCIENAFGILASRWRVLRTTMSLSPENATLVTLACCCLHNFLMKVETQSSSRTYCPVSFADYPTGNGSINEGAWRRDASQMAMVSVSRQGANNASKASENFREVFANYFLDKGKVSWQDNK